MKYKGIIKVYLEDGDTPVDVKSSNFIGADFTFTLDEKNHNPYAPEGHAIHTEVIYMRLNEAMQPILNHLVYLQQHEKQGK